MCRLYFPCKYFGSVAQSCQPNKYFYEKKDWEISQEAF